MSAPTIEVLALQLRQIQSQLETLLADGGPLFKLDMLPGDFATLASRLDCARFAVHMARIRADSMVPQPLPICAHDGKLPAGDREEQRAQEAIDDWRERGSGGAA